MAGGVPTHIARENARRATQRLERVEIAAALYCQGYTHKAISEKMGVSPKTVNEVLGDARALWRESAASSIAEHRAQQLAKIDTVELEAWAAWRRSQRNELSKETISAPDGVTRKNKKRRKDGDAVYLALVQKCIDQRIRLLGLDITEAAGGPQSSLLEVVISTRAEAQKVLTYTQFENAIEG